jgi:hypothetical protein
MTRPAPQLAALLTLLATAATAAAQPRLPGVVAAPTPWANKLFVPDIQRDPSQAAPVEVVQDFGTLPKGTLAVHKFIITNVYAVPLQVTEIRRTSEAVQAYPPEKVLQPNDKAEFVVTLDTAQFTGARSETLQVSFGTASVSTATIRLKATSRADVMLAPGSFNFGIVGPGATPTKSVTVEYAGKSKDWSITGVVPPNGTFEVTTSSGGKNKTKISVTLKTGTAAPGPFNDFLQLVTNDPTTPVINVAINGTLQTPLKVSPAAIAFPAMKLGQTVSFRVIVSGNDVGAFKIDPLPDTGDGLTVETLNGASPIHTIVVKFTPTKAGDYKRDLQIKTTIKGTPTVDISVTAPVVP